MHQHIVFLCIINRFSFTSSELKYMHTSRRSLTEHQTQNRLLFQHENAQRVQHTRFRSRERCDHVTPL